MLNSKSNETVKKLVETKDLTVNGRIVSGSVLDIKVDTYGPYRVVSASNNLKVALKANQETLINTPHDIKPIRNYGMYQNIRPNVLAYVSVNTNGDVKIIPYADVAVGTAINFMIEFLSN